MSLNVDGVLENERYATTSRRARAMHRRVARWTGSSDDRHWSQRSATTREHVGPKAVNALHNASAFGGATRCIASCGTECRKFAFLSRSQEKMYTSVPEKRLTVPFGNQRRYFLSRDRTSKKWDRTSKKRDRKGGTER